MSLSGDRIKAQQTGANCAPSALVIGVDTDVHTATSSYVNGLHATSTTDPEKKVIHGVGTHAHPHHPISKISILFGTEETMTIEAIEPHGG